MRSVIKSVATLGVVLCVSLSLTACGSDGADDASGETGVAGKKVCMDKGVTVPASASIETGARTILEEAGVEFVVKPSDGDAGTAQTILSQFDRDGCDVFMTITTTGTQATAAAIKDKPVVFAGPSTPVEAGAVDSLEKPGGNVTGVAAPFPVEAQIDAVLAIDPSIESIGLIWQIGDPAGDPLAEQSIDYLEELGIESVAATISNASEASQAAQSLVGKVDAIMIPGSAVALAGAPAILKVAESNDLPMFGGEGGTAEEGGLVSAAYDYENIGEEAGKFVLEVLNGADPATTAVVVPDPKISVNVKVADALGLEIPADLEYEEVGQ